MTGSLTISIEIELGWGVHDIPKQAHLSPDGSAERAYLEKLLTKADACGVPISFDVVGHLLLDECDGTHDGPYREGWFDADPGTDVETDPLFYGRDLARRVLDADVDHELCTHTFSHLLCNEASRDLIDLELRRSQSLHESIDGRAKSFVPPRHFRPDNDLLRANGIRTARYAKATSGVSKPRRFKELTVGPHPDFEPQIVDGVLETYCTTYPSLTAASLPSGQSATPPLFRVFPLEARKRTHRYYLRTATERAVDADAPLHLWCHLYDLSNQHQWSVLADYLEYLATVPSDDLEIHTMASLADQYLADASVP